MLKRVNFAILICSFLMFTNMYPAVKSESSSSLHTAQEAVKKVLLLTASGALGYIPCGFSNLITRKLSNRVSVENKEVVLTGWSVGASLYYFMYGYIFIPLIVPPVYDYKTLRALENKAYPESN